MLDYYLKPEYWPETLEERGYIHEDNLPDLDNVRSNIKEIIKAMYLTGDVAYMESCLDEVCYELNIDIDKGDPIIGMIGKQHFLNFMNTQEKHHE